MKEFIRDVGREWWIGRALSRWDAVIGDEFARKNGGVNREPDSGFRVVRSSGIVTVSLRPIASGMGAQDSGISHRVGDVAEKLGVVFGADEFDGSGLAASSSDTAVSPDVPEDVGAFRSPGIEKVESGGRVLRGQSRADASCMIQGFDAEFGGL